MKLISTAIALNTFLLCFAQAPTWSSDVAKIIYGNCTTCHRPGGIGPFSLQTYDEVSAMANWVQQAIEQRDMPPWTPDHTYKNYVHERVVSDADISIFQNWVAAGTPSGDLRFAPPVPTYPSGSQLGTANLNLSIGSYMVSGNGDVYRNFEIPSGLSQAEYATAIEVLPGNPSIVHHVLVFTDSTANPINPNSVGGTGSSASQLLYSWVPGAAPYFSPEGTGFRLPANTRVILQIHYAPGSAGQTDNTEINFKTSTSPLRKITVSPVLNQTNLENGPLVIPANTIQSFTESVTIPAKFTALYVFPHMHLLGKNVISYGLKPITGDTIRFVKIDDWDFHWQDNFAFANSVVLPVGTTLKATATYDNTSSNPENPNVPPQTVTLGEGTGDEMMLMFFAYMPFLPGDENLIMDKRVIPKGATTFCEGQSVELTTIKGEGYTYQWKKDGVDLPGEINYSLVANSSGSYTVEITLGPNVALSDPISVTVNSAPTAQIVPPANTEIPLGGTIDLNAVQGTGYLYQWYLNGYAVPGWTNPDLTTEYNGEYVLEIFNGGCYQISESLTLTGGLATLEELTSTIRIFPNPSKDIFTIKCNMTDATVIRVKDITGSELRKFDFNGTSISIDLRDQSEGVYFVEIIGDGNKILQRRKIIKVG